MSLPTSSSLDDREGSAEVEPSVGSLADSLIPLAVLSLIGICANFINAATADRVERRHYLATTLGVQVLAACGMAIAFVFIAANGGDLTSPDWIWNDHTTKSNLATKENQLPNVTRITPSLKYEHNHTVSRNEETFNKALNAIMARF